MIAALIGTISIITELLCQFFYVIINQLYIILLIVYTNNLISSENIPCVDLLFHIIEHRIVAIGYDCCRH